MSTRLCLRVLPSLAVGLVLVGPALAAEPDPLPEVRDRMKVEAQRVEKRFKEGREKAYRMVRADAAKYVDAVEEIHTLLALMRNDTALQPMRRKVLLVTLEADLRRLRGIAAERRRAEGSDTVVSRSIRSEARREAVARREDSRRSVVREVEAIVGSRGKMVADARGERTVSSDRFRGAMGSVARSASGPTRDFTLPDDWFKKLKRKAGAKLTAKEQAILTALNKVIGVDFTDNTFGQVIEYLEKVTGQSFAIDRRALMEANVSDSETTISLRLRGTTRSVLKRILADVGLAYVIKNEQIQITSIARAREMTTTRVYDVSDIVARSLNPARTFFNAADVLLNGQMLVTMITQTVDPQSWQVNNPDAPGTITFDPVRRALIVKQTAELHMMMGMSP
jgi:hypothetical protein